MTSEDDLPVKKLFLSPPSLAELATSISAGLSINFSSSSCTIETPPDLTLSPFHLAGPGLTGSTRVVEVGDRSYLVKRDLTRKYDLRAVARQIDMNPSTGLLIGAGAGPFFVLGQNSELMPNFAYGIAAGSDVESVRNRTHYAKLKPDGSVQCSALPSTSDFGLMANLFCSDGEVGPCLHIRAKSRTGALNFTETIQQALKTSFGDKLISVGGVFVITSGKVDVHVMPDFPAQPFKDRAAVAKWLRHFDMDTGNGEPLVCLSVLHSGDDGGWGLRVEHTHCFTESSDSHTDKGGHYHYDVDDTKDTVEYHAWFNVAEYVYRVDPPT
ncbi:hypothetical protein LTR10_019520 [Elasticomyces elasticus]|uniref:DUF1907 domain-containing protein n=1 Tax=Exophiala sideris TaxID=1016849 RepID=A0ABR0J716_9EURO|nr:hypothetical protein LTR10_019520 [Elasticomyces elasticus]KAK5028485.1 hypothetical protein LTS07_006576 [Exophiala sideris]KAK5035873.1 hypothetical protein LTR13_005443 [Exophiala sideris]KAK5056909.1 hypothetical protein LTR69_007547 [Exophiala sideris]KAK5181316.1 hypothetical protein LTR44_006111 [Eurotiomycetes sp. CCFEE 6388]